MIIIVILLLLFTENFSLTLVTPKETIRNPKRNPIVVYKKTFSETDQLSVCAWLNIEKRSVHAPVITFRSECSNKIFGLNIFETSQDDRNSSSSSSKSYNTFANTVVQLYLNGHNITFKNVEWSKEDWNHLCVTWGIDSYKEKSVASLYVNGEKKAEQHNTNLDHLSKTILFNGDFILGQDVGDRGVLSGQHESFHGQIAHLGVYKSRLEESTIVKMFKHFELPATTVNEKLVILGWSEFDLKQDNVFSHQSKFPPKGINLFRTCLSDR